MNDYFDWLHTKGGGRYQEWAHGLPSNAWAARPSHLPEELHNNSWVAEKGIEFVRRRDKTRPFFLNLSFHRPHPPIDPPQVFYDMYRRPAGALRASRRLGPHPRRAYQRHRRLARPSARARSGPHPRAYYAQVAHIDSQVGRVMRALERLKAGPTAVIVTADHGEMLGDHHMFRKTYAYEGSAKVPFIVSMPCAGKANRRCDAPVALEDVYPTILDMAHAEPPAPIDGRSVLPFCSDGPPPADWRDYMHGEHAQCYTPEESMQFITDGKEKYIWFTLDGREQLFDLANDPGECHDLARDPAARDRLELWRARMVAHLATRPQDGLSDGTQLLPGTLLPSVRPGLLT